MSDPPSDPTAVTSSTPTPGSWRARALTACRATTLVAISGLVIEVFIEPDPRGGGLLTLFRAMALPFAIVVRVLGERDRVSLTLTVLAVTALAAARLLARERVLPASMRRGFVPLIRELYCWLHALALMPVVLLLTISGTSRIVPAALFFLYVAHLVDSPGLARLVRVSRWLASAGAGLLATCVAVVLWGIAPSLAVLTLVAAGLASAEATHPAGSTRGARRMWAVGAVLLACCDQWNFVLAGAADSWLAWKLGLFRHATTRTMRAAPLVVLLAGQVLIGRGFALLMGFRPAESRWIERQHGVDVVLPYPFWRDPTLGEHITLTAPACDGTGALVGSISTSRWVGGGPDGIRPRLRRIDAEGRTLARGEDVIEPSYTSVLDCRRGVLAVGDAMEPRLSIVDAVTLERIRHAELPCVDPQIAAVTALESLDLWTVSCGSTVLRERETLEPAGTLPFASFDTRPDAAGFTGLDAAGSYAARIARRDGPLEIESVYRTASWSATTVTATPWGDVSVALSRLVLHDPTRHQVLAERDLGAWIRYLRGHPRLPLLTASDYLRGRVYLLRLPDLTVLGDWFVGERPRRAWLDDAGDALWVGSAAGVVRVDVRGLTRPARP